MRRSLALVLLSLALGSAAVSAQILDDPLVPRGQFRVRAIPSFSTWDSRFGLRGEGASAIEEKEPLGRDLTSDVGTDIFPGLADLEAELRSITGDGGYSGILGTSRAVVVHDITRIDFGAHLGVFDWLTVGAVVPWVKTRTTLALGFRADTVAGDLGINPTLTDPDAVIRFLDAVETARSSAQGAADGICADTPAASACADALGLAERLGAFHASSQTAYFASAFFPLQGSPVGTALAGVAAGLDGELQAAGLGPIGAGVALAESRLTESEFSAIPTRGPSGIQGAALGNVESLWAIGDVELSALARILAGEVRDLESSQPRLRYSLDAGLVVRLGTGKVDDNDVFLDVGTGDGQMDYEVRLVGGLSAGRRIGVRAGARYGTQQAVNLLRRVAPPEMVMPKASTIRAVRWTPASYLGFELEPAFRLSDVLSLVGTYRFFDKGTDRYEIIGTEPAGSVPVDVADLERESGMGYHQAGVGLVYTTVSAWREGRASRPMSVHLRYVRTVAGRGGQTPVITRIELGMSLFKGFW